MLLYEWTREKHNNTEGNSLKQTSKIKQFADDTTLTMKNEEDVKQALGIVQAFGELSSLHLNKQKSEGIWLGTRKWDRGRVRDIPMKDTIKILGIYYSAHEEASKLEEN